MWSLLPVVVSEFRLCFILCLLIIRLVRFGLLSAHPLGNSCPLGWPYILIVFCLFVIFIHLTFWFKERDLAFDCSSSCSLLFYNFYNDNRLGTLQYFLCSVFDYEVGIMNKRFRG